MKRDICRLPFGIFLTTMLEGFVDFHDYFLTSHDDFKDMPDETFDEESETIIEVKVLNDLDNDGDWK